MNVSFQAYIFFSFQDSCSGSINQATTQVFLAQRAGCCWMTAWCSQWWRVMLWLSPFLCRCSAGMGGLYPNSWMEEVAKQQSECVLLAERLHFTAVAPLVFYFIKP